MSDITTTSPAIRNNIDNIDAIHAIDAATLVALPTVVKGDQRSLDSSSVSATAGSLRSEASR